MRMTILKTNKFTEANGWQPESKIAICPTNPNLIIGPHYQAKDKTVITIGEHKIFVEGSFDQIVQQINDDMKA